MPFQNQQCDHQKLKALVHYICYRCHDPSVLGATKLNKILWYSDIVAFMKNDKPITAETYVKQQFGPVPKHILGIIDDLEAERVIAVRDAEVFGYQKKEYVALKPADINQFTAEEISIVDWAIDTICHKHTAESISLASHDAIWEMAEIGEEIPLYAVWASELGEITPKDIDWAHKVLEKARTMA